jgi:hypothetical protein
MVVVVRVGEFSPFSPVETARKKIKEKRRHILEI